MSSRAFERDQPRNPFRFSLPTRWPFGGKEDGVVQRRFFGGEARGGSETPTVERIRLVQPEDYEQILWWVANPEVAKHLDPVPALPEDWSNNDEIQQAVQKLGDYYTNVNPTHEGSPGSPIDITPLTAVDQNGRLLGVGTIRWRHDRYVPSGMRIASLERIIVDPAHFDQGIGTTLAATMIELAFARGYGGRGAEQIRAWIMSDNIAQPWEKNYRFFDKIGSRLVTRAPQWREVAASKGEITDRDGMWFYLTKENYDAAKARNPHIQPCRTVSADVAFRRL